MSANLEKSSRMKGIVLSALLHGIFIAGCLALDASSSILGGSPQPDITEIQQLEEGVSQPNAKS